MVKINEHIFIPDNEIDLQAIRAQGAGGQNVNKVSTAIHLRFDILESSLSDEIKQKLISQKDSRVSKDGVLVIKAQRFRTQEKNREDAVDRLMAFIRKALKPRKKRKPTRPKKSSVMKRLDSKTRKSRTKKLRGRVNY